MNYDQIIAAIIAAIPPTLVALGAYNQARKAKEQSVETHLAVNSRMDELLRLAKAEAAAKATLDEKVAEQLRKGEAAIANQSEVKKETS